MYVARWVVRKRGSIHRFFGIKREALCQSNAVEIELSIFRDVKKRGALANINWAQFLVALERSARVRRFSKMTI